MIFQVICCNLLIFLLLAVIGFLPAKLVQKKTNQKGVVFLLFCSLLFGYFLFESVVAVVFTKGVTVQWLSFIPFLLLFFIPRIKNEKKKPIEDYKNHHACLNFDKRFFDYKNRNILNKIGFNSQYVSYLLDNHKKEVEAFRVDFSYFEMAKSSKGPQKVADGMNWNAIFCMRDILRELPQIYLSRGLDQRVKENELVIICIT
jgi:Ca2+/Na+ antiporter